MAALCLCKWGKGLAKQEQGLFKVKQGPFYSFGFRRFLQGPAAWMMKVPCCKVKMPGEGHYVASMDTALLQNPTLISSRPAIHPGPWFGMAWLLDSENTAYVHGQKQLSNLWIARTTEDHHAAPAPLPTWIFLKPEHTRALPCSWVPDGSQQVSINQKGKLFWSKKSFPHNRTQADGNYLFQLAIRIDKLCEHVLWARHCSMCFMWIDLIYPLLQPYEIMRSWVSAYPVHR